MGPLPMGAPSSLTYLSLEGQPFLPRQCGPLGPAPRDLSVSQREDKACLSPSISGLLGPQLCELPAALVPRELRCEQGHRLPQVT